MKTSMISLITGLAVLAGAQAFASSGDDCIPGDSHNANKAILILDKYSQVEGVNVSSLEQQISAADKSNNTQFSFGQSDLVQLGFSQKSAQGIMAEIKSADDNN